MQNKVDYLASKGIPAIWFCIGALLEQNPDAAIYAIRKGFHLGNHSNDHPAFSDLTVGECFSQIQRTDEIIDALYNDAGVCGPAMKCFRFPYGDRGDRGDGGRKQREAIQDHLRQLGYTRPKWERASYRYFHENAATTDADWSWTYDVLEWSPFADAPLFGIDSLEKVLDRMDEDEPEHGRGLNSGDSEEIMLMHDHQKTAAFFGLLIERLLDKGLTFSAPSP